jgi:cell pole-organizing protein PopZ
MEEILASIRLIISDDAKRPVERDEIAAPRSSAPGKIAAHAPAPAEEEVLDLTEELVFPLEEPAIASPPAVAARVAPAPVPAPAPKAEEEAAMEEEPRAEAQLEVRTEVHEPSPEPAIAAEPPRAPAAPHKDPQPRQEAASDARQGPVYRTSQFSARPVWSRREMPGSPQPAASPAKEAAPVRQPQRHWAQDIQMPIQDEGPVSLIPSGDPQPQMKEPSKEIAQPEVEAEQSPMAPAVESLGEKEEAAVAALAESLARSAAVAMDEEELATASDVDFAHLDEDRKAEVTETFANAIEHQSVARDRSPLPSLLDEVFREDIGDERTAIAESISDQMNFDAAGEPIHEEEETPAKATHIGAETRSSAEADAEDDWLTFATRRIQNVSERFAETPKQEMPLAQAHYVGVSPAPAPAQAAPTLEDAVRDMLRPLLKQWLNENMPRILESAIREEIAARGLLPKVD